MNVNTVEVMFERNYTHVEVLWVNIAPVLPSNWFVLVGTVE